MAIAFVQGASGGAVTGSLAVAFDSDVTAGNLIVITARISRVGDTLTVSDTLTHDYGTNDILVASLAPHETVVYSVENISGGANTVTFAIDGLDTRIGLTIREYSGAKTAADPLDDTGSSEGTDASVECGSVTMTADGVIVTGISMDGSQTQTLDTDYANAEGGTSGRAWSSDRVTTAITDEAIHTASGSNDWTGVTCVYVVPAAGGVTFRSLGLLGAGI